MIARSATKWVEVDLGAVAHNVGLIKDLVGPSTAVMAVVKANAYGHGAVPVAQAAVRGGASWLAVSSVEEGLELRHSGLTQRILNLGYTPPGALGEAVAADLSLTIYDRQSLDAFGGLRLAQPARIHVKVNTGMHRLGAAPEDAVALVRAVRSNASLQLEGFWTHFPDADGDPAFTRRQLEQFLTLRQRIEDDGASGFICHAANSAALLRIPESRLDLVRAGLIIYGVRPDAGWHDLPELRPALSWYALVTHVQAVPPGGTVGYGRTYRADEPRQVATLSVGYADGLQRRHSNRGRVIVRGRLAPIVGMVSMDQATVDVTDIPGVAVRDVACLLGSDGDVSWTAEAMASAAETIPYEVLCAISTRVPRRYAESIIRAEPLGERKAEKARER